jgi:hypothetical protein
MPNMPANPGRRLRLLLTSSPTDVSRPLVPGHLFESVAVDDDGRVTPLTAADAASLGRSADDLLDQVSDLVRRTTSPSDIRAVDTLPGLFVVVAGDGLAASRMRVLPALYPRLPLGGLVTAVPGPDQLLCVPMHTAGSIDALQMLASALGHAATHREFVLSDQLFWFDGAVWTPIEVQHGEEDITVLPPPDFVSRMRGLASMDLVQVAGEA